MPGNAPVDAVGGAQTEGPWPEGVEEIVEGEAYRREVVNENGDVVEREVTVTKVEQIVRPDGTETDGYIVAFQHSGGP